MTELPPLPDTIVDELNGLRGGLDGLLGLRFISATYEEIIAELEVGPRHHQPYGIVHGGVYSAMVETLAATGAAINLRAQGFHTVGLDNHTSFLRAVRSGTLVGRAEGLTRGRRTQLWEVTITHEGQRVASGRVRMLAVEAGATIAGEPVGFRG